MPCVNLEETIAFFINRLGFRVETIFPADAPEIAVISGHGSRLRLIRVEGPAPTIRLVYDQVPLPDLKQLNPPDGVCVELVSASPVVELPTLASSFHISRFGSADWGVGRAGMRYRDLIPDRQGGAFIASHIHIPEGGPVPDYPHFHKIRFQMIYCHKGWVQVVYEDQGDAFIMHPGDCVLQPPEIRHRVLECSTDLEVVEIGCPAAHETWADHELTLPTDRVNPRRLFSGQRFVRHVAAEAKWTPWTSQGFEYRDTGIAQATNEIASVAVIRRNGSDVRTTPQQHHRQLAFSFVLKGSATLLCDNHDKTSLSVSDSYVIPPNHNHLLEDCSNDLELLQVNVS